MGVFVRGPLAPGDRIRARLQRVRKRMAEATLEDLVEPAADRIQAPCPHFGRCGGCRWQMLPAERVLDLKISQLQEALQRIGGVGPFEMKPAVPALQAYAYRNKADFVFSKNADEELSQAPWAMGFHVHGVGNAVRDLDQCLLIPEELNRTAQAVRAYLEAQSWHAWDSNRRAGLLRSLTVRRSETHGDGMVNLVTSGPVPDPYRFAEAIMEQESLSVSTVVNTVSTHRNRRVHEHVEVIAGPGWIEEEVMGRLFQLPPQSFFQPNRGMAEQLYRTVLEWAACRGTERVVELYSGLGALSFALADQCRRVDAFESDRGAVQTARAQADRFGMHHVHFKTAILGKDATMELPRDLDLVVTDPPREGMEESVIQMIAASGVPSCIYISCSPVHLARDASRLNELGYRLERVQAFDCFPQTSHLEVVAQFARSL